MWCDRCGFWWGAPPSTSLKRKKRQRIDCWLSIVNFFYNHADPLMFTCEELIGALTLKNPWENMQHAHRFFHLGVHVPFYLHFWGCNVPSNSSLGGTKKMNCIFSTQGHAPCCFFVNITQSWRKLFFSVWHWVRQEVGFCLTHGLCVCPTTFL
jgi:hypothetical protein